MKSLFSRACRILFAWIATIGLMAALVAQASAAEGRERVYFGTYGNGPTAGVFVAVIVVTVVAVAMDQVIVLIQRMVNVRLGKTDGGRLVI